jgi:hypothetical protein
MKPWLKWTLIALPLVVGGFIVYRKLRKPDETPKDTPPEEKPKETTAPVTTTTAGSGFPLKKGSRGALVKKLQGYILKKDPKALPKFKADGDFGNETEAWLQFLFQKLTVANQAELDEIARKSLPTYKSGAPLVFRYQEPSGQSPFLNIPK